MPHRLVLDIPEGAFSALRQDPEGFGREMRLAAAVKWYEMGLIIIPDAVAAEVLRGPAGDPAAGALQTESWLQRAAGPDVPLSVAAWDLGMGEAEVLA